MHDSGFTRRSMLAGMLASSILRGFGANAASASDTAAPTGAVDTTAGKVRGKQSGGVSTFYGIPYGQDSRGFRFRPAMPPKPWTGVRECVSLGHQAPQFEEALRAANSGVDFNSEFVKQVIAAGKEGKPSGNESEDCLVLNVYTPSASAHRKRPVMVWLHGGGFAIGSAGEPQYDGSHLVRRGDVVVVGINHRLNALGYLYLGAMHEDFEIGRAHV